MPEDRWVDREVFSHPRLRESALLWSCRDVSDLSDRSAELQFPEESRCCHSPADFL